MAWIRIDSEGREIRDRNEVLQFLEDHGILFERWELEDRVSPDATSEEILAAYKPEIERLKQAGGYSTADVVAITPQTPGLQDLIVKFGQEHTHSDDEVRFTIKGKGVFYIHPDNEPVFGVYVEAGDLISVPAGVKHWFLLCDDQEIRCIRLFEDPSGWEAHYTGDTVHEGYMPVCWGPAYIPPATVDPKKVVKP